MKDSYKKKYITKSERVKFNKNLLKYKDTFYDPIGELGHTAIGMHSIKLTEAIPAIEPPSRDLRYKRQAISDNMKLKQEDKKFIDQTIASGGQASYLRESPVC